MLRLRPRRLSDPPHPPSNAPLERQMTPLTPPHSSAETTAPTTTQPSLFETSFAGLFEYSPEGEFTRVNATFAKMCGYDSSAEFMKHVFTYSALAFDSDHEVEYFRHLREAGEVNHWETQFRKRDEDPAWVEVNAREVRDESGKLLFVEGAALDISRYKTREDQLTQHAFHDKLTGLPDRALFLERVERCIKRRARRQDYWFAVLFLDLDRFKIVNDSLGHSAGDQLLIAAAQKLGSSLRPGDTVARLGGDEFAILLDDINDVADATSVANRIQHLFTAPTIIEGHEVFTSASIGIALISRNHERPSDVLRDADTAMYRAKAAGKAQYAIFDAEMHADAKNILQLESDLRQALKNREFHAKFQPIISLGSGRIVGFEAFLRWQHPTRGWVSPADFVGLAEETGLLVAIDRWILGEACRRMASWQARFPAHTLLTMSVNMSSRQFAQSDLMDEMERILRHAGLAPRSLRLEMTEKSLLASPDATESMIRKLNALGVQMSLDDFGTGYLRSRICIVLISMP